MTNFKTLNGFSDYLKTITLMEDKVLEVINGLSDEAIYLVEHDDIYTAGTNYRPEELLKSNNIPVIYTGRGGKFTYHGPRQRVIYPILNLSQPGRQKDLRLYVRMLEQWIINTLSHFNINGYTVNERGIGIWVMTDSGEAKIAAIGIRVRRWVTYHGIAVNIAPDLDKYSGIIPCGLESFPVTSLLKLGVDVSFDKFDQALKQEFNRVFG
jgi:lipoyl(octanoyl) transferase